MKNIIYIVVAILMHSLVFAAEPAILTLETERSTAVVSLFGGRVMSLKIDGEELLWHPIEWNNKGDKWCHGGIPICWPWFGSSGPNKNVTHGFAWRSLFEVRSKKVSPVRSELVLGLRPSPKTRKEWPHEFDLEYTIVLTDILKLTLKTRNTGTAPFILTTGFHPYFFIGDRNRTVITGTDGMKYCDSRLTTDYNSVWKGNMKLLSSFDHVFVETYPTALHKIIDPLLDRRIAVSSSGAKRLVVWNPGIEEPASKKPMPGDLAIGDWQHLVCVEPAILWKEAAIDMKPGAVHELATEISVKKGVGK
jgi:glucose-6-phosphate 1-epimerase